jgi:hypothetical protein
MPCLNGTRTVRRSGPESGRSVSAVTITSAPALDRWGPPWQELHHEDDHRDDEQERDEAPQGRGGDQTEEPQHSKSTQTVQSLGGSLPRRVEGHTSSSQG